MSCPPFPSNVNFDIYEDPDNDENQPPPQQPQRPLNVLQELMGAPLPSPPQDTVTGVRKDTRQLLYNLREALAGGGGEFTEGEIEQADLIMCTTTPIILHQLRAERDTTQKFLQKFCHIMPYISNIVLDVRRFIDATVFPDVPEPTNFDNLKSDPALKAVLFTKILLPKLEKKLEEELRKLDEEVSEYYTAGV